MFHLTMATATTVFGLVMLAWILWTLLREGSAALSPMLLTEATPAPGSSGGLSNAIVGSLIILAIGSIASIPLGILVGTYLAEYAPRGRLSAVIRFVNDVLLSAPSILIGLFVYELLVVPMGNFSAIAGAMALAVIALPVVVRTAEDMLSLVPSELREAATALGAPRWKVTVLICYRAARSGLLTGALLAIARISGETAPLLFTALNNQFWSLNLERPMANLPVVIFQFAMSPYEDWQRLAWAGALLLTGGVLALTVVARFLLRPAKRREG
ncbi:MAG TPA: phosphate ABC transporter permease PstA [Alphaproteobacteria bacterium]|nr:phosphate ABC transporter permease PstA [Alphaproteobacteria bacterium]